MKQDTIMVLLSRTNYCERPDQIFKSILKLIGLYIELFKVGFFFKLNYIYFKINI